MTMTFGNFTIAGGATSHETLDLSQCASIINRRFYRQGLSWVVAGFKFLSNVGTSGVVGVYKIPQTWTASNSWEKVFRTWKKQQDEAIADGGSQSAVAKWRDFKIHMDTLHVDDGFAANIIPFDHTLLGEWQHSQIVIPNVSPDASGSLVDPSEYALHMVGVNNHGGLSRGMIDGYSNSRAYPQSPDPVSPPVESADNWLREMFDVGDDTSEVVDNAVDRNDELPYDQTEYPGGAVQAPVLATHDISFITGTTVGGTTRIKGGLFPCGLVRISFQNDSEVPMVLTMQVDLVPGPSRGYLTQSMTEM